MRSSYKVLDNSGIFFVSSSVVEMIPVFTSDKYFQIITESLVFCQKEKRLKIYCYVIMDNHFHLIVAGENLPNIMRSLKRYTAQEILKTLEKDKKKWLLNQLSYYKKKHKKSSDHQVWQEGYHPQQIFSDEMYEQKVNYIHFNPVKRGFVSEEENWKYSSANNTDFDGNPIIVLDDVNEMRFE